ncbi:hypothetical protein MANES_05G050350v8 [Manihot esculenta]|uniref:Uncharacterized protein n=1 Tax=Manihot esculenta TaxID=3983 RepID=A0ACB7HNG7_MANES|nr:hypothetical protein MANES_05G050350v8 [Manihot esculenta]
MGLNSRALYKLCVLLLFILFSCKLVGPMAHCSSSPTSPPQNSLAYFLHVRQRKTKVVAQ